MNPLDVSVGRRGFLTASAWAAGAVLVANGVLTPRSAFAATPGTLPDLGQFDTGSGGSWTDAFVSGNGELGAMLYGAPGSERVVLNHHRFVLPNGTRTMLPPDIASRLAGVQNKAMSGDYSGAEADFTSGWTLQWTQTFHPGYALTLDSPNPITPTAYQRTTDYRSGEITHTWTDSAGTWTRRMFASRGSAAVVHELQAPAGQTIDLVLGADTALPGTPSDVSYSVGTAVSGRNGYLTVDGVYPANLGAYGFQGVTRAAITGSGASIAAVGKTIRISRAARVILLTKLGRYESASAQAASTLKSELGVMLTDYDALLRRHLPAHRALFDGSSFQLTSAASATSGAEATTAAISRQLSNRSSVDLALLEAMYDSGRYMFVSASGILPPRLTGLWTGEWGGAWADDFTTDANVNLQVAGGNLLHTGAMAGYFDLVLGQLKDWRDNARLLYGARGFLAPTRTDGEYGHMLHFTQDFPGHCWTGGADWLLYPLIEYYEVTGDEAFYRTKLAPVLMELALFYEDYLTRTDQNGRVVFVPSFSMENSPSSTGVMLSINATGEISAGRHALQAAIEAAQALGVESGPGAGIARWQALLAKLPDYVVNGDDALAEWAWPGLTDRYNHRHVHHMYGVWPLHEINPEDESHLSEVAHRALDKRGDENLSAHGSLHRALSYARLKDGVGVDANIKKILANNMVFPSLMTSHNPNLTTYNADAAHALPGVISEALVYSRPGFLDLLPAVPEQWDAGSITGVRGRNRILVERLAWDFGARTAQATLVSAVAQTITLVSRRGILSIAADNAVIGDSDLGLHARTLRLAAGVRTNVQLELFPTVVRLINRNSGKVMDVNGGSSQDGAAIIQWPWSGSVNQKWKLLPGYGGALRVIGLGSGKALDNPASSTTPGQRLDQWTDGFTGNQWWRPVPTSGGYHRLFNMRSGLCLDLEGGSSADAARVVQNTADDAAPSQEWRLDAV